MCVDINLACCYAVVDLIAEGLCSNADDDDDIHRLPVTHPLNSHSNLQLDILHAQLN